MLLLSKFIILYFDFLIRLTPHISDILREDTSKDKVNNNSTLINEEGPFLRNNNILKNFRIAKHKNTLIKQTTGEDKELNLNYNSLLNDIISMDREKRTRIYSTNINSIAEVGGLYKKKEDCKNDESTSSHDKNKKEDTPVKSKQTYAKTSSHKKFNAGGSHINSNTIIERNEKIQNQKLKNLKDFLNTQENELTSATEINFHSMQSSPVKANKISTKNISNKSGIKKDISITNDIFSISKFTKSLIMNPPSSTKSSNELLKSIKQQQNAAKKNEINLEDEIPLKNPREAQKEKKKSLKLSNTNINPYINTLERLTHPEIDNSESKASPSNSNLSIFKKSVIRCSKNKSSATCKSTSKNDISLKDTSGSISPGRHHTKINQNKSNDISISNLSNSGVKNISKKANIDISPGLSSVLKITHKANKPILDRKRNLDRSRSEQHLESNLNKFSKLNKKIISPFIVPTVITNLYDESGDADSFKNSYMDNSLITRKESDSNSNRSSLKKLTDARDRKFYDKQKSVDSLQGKEVQNDRESPFQMAKINDKLNLLSYSINLFKNSSKANDDDSEQEDIDNVDLLVNKLYGSANKTEGSFKRNKIKSVSIDFNK